MDDRDWERIKSELDCQSLGSGATYRSGTMFEKTRVALGGEESRI
jgi:hypothetical protein